MAKYEATSLKDLADFFDMLAKWAVERRSKVEAARGKRCREYHVLTAEINAYWNARDIVRNTAMTGTPSSGQIKHLAIVKPDKPD